MIAPAKFLRKYCSAYFGGKTIPLCKELVFGATVTAVLVPSAALARVVITEVMYDLASGSDSGREWVEVYNPGPAPVRLADRKLFENGTSHKIVSVAGNDTLVPNSYAVIADNPAKFKTDWPAFSGQLFDSTFSLSNDGETIALRDASSTDVSTIVYTSSQGAAGDGNSLGRSPGDTSLIARRPSPGTMMSFDVIPPPAPKPAPPSKTTTKKSSPSKSVATEPVYPSDPSGDVPATEDAIADDATTSELVAAAAASSPGSSFAWWLGAIAIAALAAGALALARRHAKNEWDIVEEKSE